MREFGEVLAEHNFLEEAEDIFQLYRREVLEVLEELALTWATGGQPLGPDRWPPIVARRKELLAKLRSGTRRPRSARCPRRSTTRWW